MSGYTVGNPDQVFTSGSVHGDIMLTVKNVKKIGEMLKTVKKY